MTKPLSYEGEEVGGGSGSFRLGNRGTCIKSSSYNSFCKDFVFNYGDCSSYVHNQLLVMKFVYTAVLIK